MKTASTFFRPIDVRRYLAACAIAAIVVFAAWFGTELSRGRPYKLQVTIDAETPGFTQVYFDRGLSLRESDSSKQSLKAGRNLVELPLPVGSIKSLRFDPIDHRGRAKFGTFRVIDPTGKTIREISPREFVPTHQIADVQEDAGMLVISTTPDADDPQLSLNFDPPLELSARWAQRFYASRYWLLSRYLIAMVVGILAGNTWRNRSELAVSLKSFTTTRPRTALAIVSVLAAVISSYPVVFFGRSFVSPNTLALLYNKAPSVPGYEDSQAEDARGADVGAMLWQHYSYTAQQHRALAAGELPLWNRFVGCGVTLFGQGQSMLGDPLQFLVVLADGASWAFDLKFILAKALFACGVGWCVWYLVRDFSAAAISTVSGVFIAFFNYRLNHPSIFTLGYTPWILAAWLQLKCAGNQRAFRYGLLLWYAANWLVITSGTVKEAYVLALTVNLTGALIFFSGAPPRSDSLRRAALLALAVIAFSLLSAPFWRTFLGALNTSYTSYDTPSLIQAPGQWFVGLFDDIFYREFTPWHYVYKPAANFLVLLGCCWAVLQPRRLAAAGAPLFIALGALGGIMLAFRFGPPAWAPRWVLSVPLLRNIANLDTVFSHVAIVHLAVLSGWGFFAARQPLSRGKTARYGWMMLALLVLLFGAYFLIPPDNFAMSHHWPGWKKMSLETGLTYLAVFLLPLAAWVLTLFAAYRLRGGKLNAASCLVIGVGIATLLGRHGQHLRGIPTTYIAAPGPRADLQAFSPVVDALKKRTADEPARVFGLDHNMFPGFASSYGLEFIFGANALENRWYRQFAEAAGLVLPGLWDFETKTEDLLNWRPFADFLNVRYLVAPPGLAFPTAGFRFISSFDLDLYENEHYWPRAFFTDQLEHYSTPGELAQRIRARAGQGPFAAIQIGEDLPTGLRPAVEALLHNQRPHGIVPAYKYTLGTNVTSFNLEAPGPGVAVLHETWLPDDFVVTVNGDVTPYLRINHAFKGVVLPAAGTYRIRFSYWPKGLNTSLAMSALGFVLMIGTCLATRRLSNEDRVKGHSETQLNLNTNSPHLDEEFYRRKSWGSLPIQSARDLPSLKMRYLSELLARRTATDARLLEVGCGSGRILSSIHQREPDLKLTGIDLSAEQIALAQRSHPAIEFVCGNGEALPFASASFDYVVFFDYLEHIERPRQSLQEMYRVLKPGGQLHLVCPAERQSIYGWSARIFRRHFKEGTAGHIQQFSRRDLGQLVEDCGFRVSDRHYSYHLLGSLMDYTLFALMLHPRVYAIYWSSNPYYATTVAPARRGFFQRVLRCGNAVAYYESRALSRVAWSATAVHFTARKPS